MYSNQFSSKCFNEKGYKIIRNKNMKKKLWSGGKALELYIYPENCEYENKDFVFVLTTASVDVEDSIFTVLNNYDRVIMTLDNDFLLNPNEKDEILLKKYMPHTFYGDDKTIGKGKVNSDYNLIMARGICFGDINAMSITKGSLIYPRKGFDSSVEKLEIVYCAKGQIIFKIDNKNNIINQGDIVVINHRIIGEHYAFANEDDQMCDIVIATAEINKI